MAKQVLSMYRCIHLVVWHVLGEKRILTTNTSSTVYPFGSLIYRSVFRGEMRLGRQSFLPFVTWDRSLIIKRQKDFVKKFLLNTFMNWSSWLLTNWLLTLIKCRTFSYFFWNLSFLEKIVTYNWLDLLHCSGVILYKK